MSAAPPRDKVEVLIVDDSATARAALAEICGRDPDLRVVGQAGDGDEAVRLAVRLRPTVILMDITMPGLDGYEATRRIMTQAPTRVVMVTAANDPSSVDVALRAMEAGALTVLPKPVLADDKPQEAETRAFLTRVKLLSDVGVIRRHERRPAQPWPMPAAMPTPEVPARIIAIATSTGGPQALHHLLGHLPADFSLPIVVVQHIVDGFIPGLAHWLHGKVAVHVKVAANNEPLRSGTVYLAPDDHHLTISRRHTVTLDSSPPVKGFRPSATALLDSIGEVYGPSAIGVILTGMGNDGLEGARVLANRGGIVLAQDQATSVVYGMPGAVANEGLAHSIGPVDFLAKKLMYLAVRGLE